ncbi:TonB-dependent receptor [Novosphingobium endophyticum]|uniref:TonB-dependent receptor n=1 Tax=Novosphingobium endophyticum TaxID=1955250 RepID=A0A916TQU7_9SPHN|nr:TonB-dependent receptor [Novosphingobium endophyticum]GGB92927.1 TonB-dependent receptor [Novosphingobium endophyticum]
MADGIDRTRVRALYGTALAGLLALSAPAQAQSAGDVPEQTTSRGLSEIIVTAQRRAENLQEVPIAIAAVTAEALDRAGINETNTISQIVPSVNFQRSGASGLFFVRGVGTTNASVGDEGSNAFYVDGVYVPDLSGTVTQFNNIERIEVLKGPQGTLFGRNAFGGLIHIITKEPGETFEASGEAGLANYETVHGKLYVGGPIAENLSMDLALTGYDQGKGWGRNLTVDRDIKKMQYWGARSKLVWRATDDVKVTLGGDYYDMDDNTAIGWSIDEDYPSRGFTGPVFSVGSMDTQANDYSLTKLESWGINGTIEADLGPVSLTSISSVRDSKNVSDFDVDGGPLPWLRIAFTSGSRAYQQELRLASNDTDPLSWQVGAFYLRSEVFNRSMFSGLGLSPLSGLFIDATLDTDSYAGFGEVSYKITPTTTITGGIRYTEDIRKLGGGQSPIVGTTMLPQIPTEDKISYGKFTYRAALRQELSEDISVYASYNRGFKAGTYSLQSPANAPVNPQFIDAFEIGVKSELFNRMLRLNASVFHYDISNYQIRSAALSNLGSAVLLNAASVKVDGLDVEFEAAPMDSLRLFGGFTLLDSRFDNFGAPGSDFQAPFIYPLPAVCDAPGTSDPGTSTGTPTGGFLTCLGDASGLQTPGAPDFTASLGMSYSVDLDDRRSLRFNLLGSYNSGFPFESDGTLRQKEYALLNGSVAYWVTENWGVEIWGKNITGTKYFQQKISTGLGATTARAAPSTYGVTVKFDY